MLAATGVGSAGDIWRKHNERIASGEAEVRRRHRGKCSRQSRRAYMFFFPCFEERSLDVQEDLSVLRCTHVGRVICVDVVCAGAVDDHA